MEEDVVVAIELNLLTSNIQREVYNVLGAFLSFKKKFDEKKTQNMFALMLDMSYKNLRIVSTFVNKELGVVVVVVEEYDKKALSLCF